MTDLVHVYMWLQTAMIDSTAGPLNVAMILREKLCQL